MNFHNYDLCLITDPKQRLYFLGFNSSAGYLIFNNSHKTFVVDKRYYYAAKKKLEPRGYNVICGSGYERLITEVENLQVESIGIDFSVTTVKQLNVLKKTFPGIAFVDIGDEIAEMASIKSTEELKAIEKACKIAEKSFNQVLKSLKEGVTEKEIAAELEYLFEKNGASDKSFDSIIAFGPNAAVPHHESGKTRLRKNMPVLMDFGCIYQGYCSDMTRTVWFGDTPDEKFLQAYNAVYDAHMNAFNTIQAGMTGAEADATAREVLVERGYDQYLTHSLGHGIGVNIHEYPWLAPNRDCLLVDGMVFSNEPGVYFDGKFGIRIEDTSYLKDGRVHTLMADDKKLIIVNNGKVKKY